MTRAGKQGPALQHFGKDTRGAPDIDLTRIRLPGEHDLRRPVVPRCDVAGHLWFLQSGKAEVTDFQVAVLVYEDVAGF